MLFDLMFQDSISSELLGSPSSQELAQEIYESQAEHQKTVRFF